MTFKAHNSWQSSAAKRFARCGYLRASDGRILSGSPEVDPNRLTPGP